MIVRINQSLYRYCRSVLTKVVGVLSSLGYCRRLRVVLRRTATRAHRSSARLPAQQQPNHVGSSSHWKLDLLLIVNLEIINHAIIIPRKDRLALPAVGGVYRQIPCQETASAMEFSKKWKKVLQENSCFWIIWNNKIMPFSRSQTSRE